MGRGRHGCRCGNPATCPYGGSMYHELQLTGDTYYDGPMPTFYGAPRFELPKGDCLLVTGTGVDEEYILGRLGADSVFHTPNHIGLSILQGVVAVSRLPKSSEQWRKKGEAPLEFVSNPSNILLWQEKKIFGSRSPYVTLVDQQWPLILFVTVTNYNDTVAKVNSLLKTKAMMIYLIVVDKTSSSSPSSSSSINVAVMTDDELLSLMVKINAQQLMFTNCDLIKNTIRVRGESIDRPLKDILMLSVKDVEGFNLMRNLLDICIAMAPLCLPPYILLELYNGWIEHRFTGRHNALKLRIIDSVRNAYESGPAKRISKPRRRHRRRVRKQRTEVPTTTMTNNVDGDEEPKIDKTHRRRRRHRKSVNKQK